MIYLRITDLLLSPPVTHINTDWQVSSNMQFTNITVQSLGDTTNLTSILFDTPLDPAIKYYARSRVLLSTGYTAWSNIDIFTPQNVPDNTINAPLPSLVSLPAITITGNGNNVPIFGTTINIAPVSTLGGANHKSTSYVLEDIDGKVVWKSLYNVKDRNKKVIPPYIMLPSTIYRIRILIHTDSNDSSQVLTTTIKTAARSKGLIINNLEGSLSTADLHVDIMSSSSISGIVGTLYSIINDQTSVVGTYTAGGVASNVITVPAASLRPATKYIIRIATSDPSIWDQKVFNTL